MGTYTTIKKVGIFLAILIIASIVSGQTRLTNEPIVSDKVVTPTDSIKIVDKDEIQRVSNKLVERIQILENKVSVLESRVRSLEAQDGGG